MGPIVISVLGIKENKKKMRVASTVLTSSLLSSFFSVYLLKSLSRVVFQLAPLCFMGFPWGLTVKESACSCRRPGFNSWVGKIPWRRERLPTPVFWPGEFHGLYGPWGHKESGTTEQLSLSFSLCFILGGGRDVTFLKVRAGNPLHILEAMRINTAAAAAAAKSLQSCLTLCDPIDGSPPGSPVPGILQARTLEWVAISFSNA